MVLMISFIRLLGVFVEKIQNFVEGEFLLEEVGRDVDEIHDLVYGNAALETDKLFLDGFDAVAELEQGAFEFFLAVGFLLAGQYFAVFFDFVQVVGPLVKGLDFNILGLDESVDPFLGYLAGIRLKLIGNELTIGADSFKTKDGHIIFLFGS